MKVFGHSGSMTFPMSYDYQGEYYDFARKGWKGMSPLEKSLSVSLGVCSTICVALMIAVIVVGVNRDCKTVINTTTPPPVTSVTSTQPGRCDTTTRPRPPKRGSGATTESSLTTGGDGSPGSSNFNSNRASCINSDQFNATICLTSECFKKAGNIIQSMNFDINPCQNFFQFACGNWAKYNPTPSDRHSWSANQDRKANILREIKNVLEKPPSSISDTRSFQLAQKFYHSCTHPTDDEVGVAEMRLLIDEMTANLDNGVDPMSYLAKILPNIRSSLNGNFIVSLEVDVDDKNTEENAIYLDHPTFGLSVLLATLGDDGDGNYVNLEWKGSDAQTQVLYRDFLKRLWLLVFPEEVNNVDTLIADVLEFEGSLMNISTSDAPDDPREIKDTSYNSLESLDNTLIRPSILTWMKELVKNVLQQSSDGLSRINSGPNIVVRDLEYFGNLESILNETNFETIKTYLQLRILLEHGAQSGEPCRNLFLEFEKKIIGLNLTKKPRWETCVELANDFFGWTLSNEFLQDGLLDMNLDVLNDTANYIKDAINERLNDLEWIADNETRGSAKRKLDLMETFIAYPDWLYATVGASENAVVESFYANMNFTDPSNYFQNYLEMKMWLSKKMLAAVYEPTRNRESLVKWPKTLYPTSWKSIYLENLNTLVLPAGAIDTLAQPADDSDVFPSLMYGSFGTTAAQNMLRAINDRGSIRDGRGKLGKWWDNKTLESYKNFSSCLSNQYSGLQVDGGASSPEFDENMLQDIIVKDGGLSLAYLAYQFQVAEEDIKELLLPGLQDFSQEQLFFLAFAQTQCSAPSKIKAGTRGRYTNPGEFFLQTITRNSVDFARQWKCALPSNPNCRIF